MMIKDPYMIMFSTPFPHGTGSCLGHGPVPLVGVATRSYKELRGGYGAMVLYHGRVGVYS